MSVATRLDRLDGYLEKRDAQFRQYIENTKNAPCTREQNFAFAAFFVEAFIREGLLPPLPVGCKTLKELLDYSPTLLEEYADAIPRVIKRPPGGVRGERLIGVRLFEEWLAASGEGETV